MQVEVEYEDDQNDTRSMTSLELAQTKNLVQFQPGDSDNPHNWSHRYRAFVAFVGILTVLNSVLGSSLPSGYATVLGEHFHVDAQSKSGQLRLVLPISVWLLLVNMLSIQDLS